jgi:endonuclease/exonuclease/phosphatase (EEP) superfamily protein YafD
MVRSLARSLWRALPVLGWLTLAAGVLLQLWLKDRHVYAALFFYAMPKPCLAALALVLALWPRVGGRQRAAAAGAVVVISAWWVAVSWSHGPAADVAKTGQGPELKVLYWNLCRPAGFDEEMVAMVNRLQPDVAAFVEPGPEAHTLVAEYQKRLPGYEVTFIPRGILWVSRLPSRLLKRGKLQGMGAYAAFEVNHGPAPFLLVTADVFPHPFLSREGQLFEAFAATRGRGDAILLGDFNTPAESVHYALYRQRFVNAFEAAGVGFRETWPLGLPLLSLDHVWAGVDWTVLKAEKIHQLRGSDHAALFVVLGRR